MKTGSSYSLSTLASFTEGFPLGGLIADAKGDLFGTTNGDGFNSGTVFEIVKTGNGYASTPTTLVNFGGYGLTNPRGNLIFDANGNLFGVTQRGGANNDGAVFEIAKTGSGYASTPITLASFSGANGADPSGSLIADANGNLFSTTQGGGANNDGTAFELVKTGSGYSLTNLVSFTGGADGAVPFGGLLLDANGDLFGTTVNGGGANNDGTVFELVNTGSGYSLSTLVTFTGANGAQPDSLIADANGNLFGTTESVGRIMMAQHSKSPVAVS